MCTPLKSKMLINRFDIVACLQYFSGHLKPRPLTTKQQRSRGKYYIIFSENDCLIY